jgi:beta-glucosidase
MSSVILQTQTQENLTFPPNFVWGAATAAYQIEGAAQEDGRSESIWDRFCATPGKVLNGDSGAVACDHYHRWREDIALMKNLGLGAYRFSISWPRVIPTGRGKVNQVGLDFYDRLVDSLLELDIQPYATLYHWDLPQILQDQGGWVNRDTAYAFAEYAEAVVQRLGDRVAAWITHNEPWCAAFLGHKTGHHAPGLTDHRAAVATAHHLLLSHGLAVPLIRQFAPRSEVGITLNLAVTHPARPGVAEDVEVARQADAEQNRLFLDPIFKGHYPADHELINQMADQLIHAGDLATISAPIDFLGINYYTRGVVQADPTMPDGVRHLHPQGTYTTMDWEVYPEGLYELLTRMQREYPTRYFITENGASTDDAPDNLNHVHDDLRLNYLREHFKQAHRAIQDGVDLKGYFVWSFLDNFEWAFGYDRRFGLIYVDYTTQERIVKESALWYSNFIRTGGNL